MSSSHPGLPCPECGEAQRQRVEDKDGGPILIVFCPACERKQRLDAWLGEHDAEPHPPGQLGATRDE